MLCIIEKLTVPSLFMNVFPRLRDLRKERARGSFSAYYIDAAPWAIYWANFIGRCLRVEFKRLDFRLIDIFADNGDLAYLKITYADLFHILSRINRSAEFQLISRKASSQEKRIVFFLAKQTIISFYHDGDILRRLLYLVYLAQCKAKQDKMLSRPVCLFVKKRLWMEEVKDYIRGWGVQLEPMRMRTVWGWKKLITVFFGEVRLRSLLYLYRCYGIRTFFATQSCFAEAKRTEDAFVFPYSGKISRLMVEYNGHLNIDNPQMHSDLFFAQQSGFRREDILVVFNYPGDPFDQAKADVLKAFGMSAVALNPKATTFSPRGIFHYSPSFNCRGLADISNNPVRIDESDWLNLQMENYRSQAAYWRAFFKRFHVSVYFSWYKNEALHAVIADVIHELGGVSALYQRSFESEPSAETAVNVDLFFGFSNEAAQIEKASGSVIPYYVITGYNGDHRFKFVENKSFEVRKQLLKNGAKYVIAFFDENSRPDTRSHTGHQFMRVNYEFLLRRALEDRSLGLVFKPKVPKTLRQRLGQVAELLKELESQGRCFVFETGAVQGSYPPAVAAKAADVAVHGHLHAATAGIESALAGVPTVFLDREGWPSCSLYAHGTEGKIIFRSWESLWPNLSGHLKHPGSVHGFADWSGLLDILDPFRDGRASERIGNYLSWVMDGLRAGHPRNQVLDDVAQRYARMWGKDKVIAINV
ncbi:MAG: hypothetical protein ABIH18_03320 [Candidatus Omnitrophota bacterium]